VLSLGAMLVGSRADEATSFAILDRYVGAAGTSIDTRATTRSGAGVLFVVEGTTRAERDSSVIAGPVAILSWSTFLTVIRACGGRARPGIRLTAAWGTLWPLRSPGATAGCFPR
jgi:hypothetical protein